MIEKLTKTVYKCTCELIDCGKSWESESDHPTVCRWCHSRNWDGSGPKQKYHLLTAKGKTQHLSAWAKETGISRQTIRHRLDTLGWSEEKAVTTPARKRRKNK